MAFNGGGDPIMVESATLWRLVPEWAIKILAAYIVIFGAFALVGAPALGVSVFWGGGSIKGPWGVEVSLGGLRGETAPAPRQTWWIGREKPTPLTL